MVSVFHNAPINAVMVGQILTILLGTVKNIKIPLSKFCAICLVHATLNSSLCGRLGIMDHTYIYT